MTATKNKLVGDTPKCYTVFLAALHFIQPSREQQKVSRIMIIACIEHVSLKKFTS